MSHTSSGGACGFVDRVGRDGNSYIEDAGYLFFRVLLHCHVSTIYIYVTQDPWRKQPSSPIVVNTWGRTWSILLFLFGMLLHTEYVPHFRTLGFCASLDQEKRWVVSVCVLMKTHTCTVIWGISLLGRGIHFSWSPFSTHTRWWIVNSIGLRCLETTLASA